MKTLGLSSATTLAITLFHSAASAQNINWSTAAGITGDANLSTAGVYFDSLIPEYTGTALTADGVLFNNDSSATTSGGGDGTISYAWTTTDNSPYDYTSFNLGSSDFNAVMNAGGAYENGLQSGSVTISGLTAGNTYSVQDFEYAANANGITTFSGATPTTINSANVGGAGTLGEYVSGTFTATGGTETFDFSGVSPASYTVLGSISVFNITSVPEPSSGSLTVAGCVVALGLARLRRRQESNS
jgi:hypothetical protein